MYEKSILILLLTALLASTLVGCNNSPDEPAEEVWAYDPADANPASDFKYETGDDGGITITRYIGTDTEVVIPEQIDGMDVTVIGRDSFSYAYNCKVVEVVMPDTVNEIQAMAFTYNTELTSVRLSQTLEKIQNNAFEGCERLSKVQLPDTLNTIGTMAFYGCTSLKHIKIPKSVTDWAEESFSFSGLETIELEDGLAVLGSWAFGATQIKEIEIPGSIKLLPNGVFSGCKNLESVILNEGIETIDTLVVAYTDKLTEIVIPDSVTKCSELAFVGCDTLQKVKFKGNAPSDFENQEPILEETYAHDLPVYTIYYHKGAEGFTSPEWCGYATEIW